MGCFSVACNLTNISLYTDDALWIPLVLSDLKNPVETGNNFSIYPTHMFTPVACPVFGNLDSYGRLEDIKHDANTAAIEKAFGMSIEDIIDEPGNVEIPGRPDVTISGTFIYAPAFRYVQKHMPGESKNGNIADLTDCDMTDEILNICGFEYVRKDGLKERYDRLFTSKRYPNVEWWSDGTWGRFSDEEYSGIYNPMSFLKVLKKRTGIGPSKKVLSTLKNGSSARLHIDRAYNKYKKAVDLDNTRNTLYRKIQEEKPSEGIQSLLDDKYSFADSEFKQFHRSIVHGEYCYGHVVDPFALIYKENVEQYLDDFANLQTLSTALSINNRFWAPQANGYQCGSKYQEMDLAKFILKDRAQRIKEYESEYGDEDEDEE